MSTVPAPPDHEMHPVWGGQNQAVHIANGGDRRTEGGEEHEEDAENRCSMRSRRLAERDGRQQAKRQVLSSLRRVCGVLG